MLNKELIKKIDMVIIYKNRYFGIDFEKKIVEEITFDEAFGKDFFDWDNNICLASEANGQKYDMMRGKDGLGFGSVCRKVMAE